MKLFEYIHDDNYYLRKLKHYYKSLGLFVEVLPPHPAPGLSVADNKEQEFDWQKDDHTGMFMYFYPLYKDATSEEDLKFLVHINSIVVAKSQRGLGTGRKMIDGLIKIFGYDLNCIEYSDYSKGFWKYMEKCYPKTKFVDTENN